MDMALVPLAGKAYAWLLGLAVGPPLLTMILLRVFQPGLGWGLFAGVVAAVLAIALGIAWSMGGNRLDVDTDTVTLQAARFNRMQKPLAALDGAHARAGDLAQMPEARTTLRTNGVGLPGYSAGWFRLARSGRALLMVTDPTRVIVLPFADGEMMIASVEDPAATLARLRDAAAR